jgi:hypothetical protein
MGPQADLRQRFAYANPGSMKRIIEESPLSERDKALVLGENIARLLHLVPVTAS